MRSTVAGSPSVFPPAAEKSAARYDYRAPRIISKSQKFCRHKEAAKEAAEKKNAISTIEKIA
jgi:hypothetical protein